MLINHPDILAAARGHLPSDLLSLATRPAVLDLRISTAGEVSEIRFNESSGHIDVDRGIAQVMRHARFEPVVEEVWLRMPFEIRRSANPVASGDGQTPRGGMNLPTAFGAVFDDYRQGCAAVMGDPRVARDQIRLIRSFARFCDYRVTPPGRYGVRQGELLRIEKGTGRPIGIVEE